MGAWLDRLLLWSHDSGAQLTGGCRSPAILGQQPRYWLTIVLPDGPKEFVAASYDSAAFGLMQQIAPDPDDRPEA